MTSRPPAMLPALVAALVAALALCAACTGEPEAEPSPTPRSASTSSSPTASAATPSPTPSPRATPTAKPSHEPTSQPTPRADPRWRFFVRDRTPRTSPWFAGAHPVMIGYGCTPAPYYAHDPRCPGRQGFHHGIDVALPCGTPLSSAVKGRVLPPDAPGAPGAAYGPYAFRIRTGGVDVLVGHVKVVYVRPGDEVRPGQRIARANDQGAPDGCHLHFEVRRAGTGLAGAVDPASYLRLRRVR